MQVSRIQNNNYNTNFGALKEIKCLGYFNKDSFDYIRVAKEISESAAFKKFGEKYDYNINIFKDCPFAPIRHTEYELYLTPAEKGETAVENLLFKDRLTLLSDDDILPCGGRNGTIFEDFIRAIKEMKYEDIIDNLKNAF